MRKAKLGKFLSETAGAALVEYAVALIVVIVVGAAIFTLGGNIAGIIDLTAGAF